MAKRSAKKQAMNVDVDKCQKAIDALYGAFTWDTSPQGYEAWRNVADALEEIIANAKRE